MVLMASWPTLTDDTGTGQDGTPVNHAFEAAVKASVEDQVHTTTNPTIKPKTITDEVVAARGATASLSARLATALGTDGALVVPATVALVADAKTLYQVNLCPNGSFLLWSAGDTSAPDYWTLSGAGAAIARVGSGLGDTWQAGYGDFACKLTYGSQEVKLTQSIVSTASITRCVAIKGRQVTVGVKCQASAASQASIVVDDGVTTTRGGSSGNGTYHTGGGTVEWLYCTHTLSASATKFSIYLSCASAGSAYFGAVMVAWGAYALLDFVPCEMQKGMLHFVSSGTLTTGTQKGTVIPGAPGIITDCQLYVITVPTGQALKVDVNTWDGAAFTTAFATKPQIAISGLAGNQVPDGTYARRCIMPTWGTALATGGALTFDIDQVGSGVAGADLVVEVRVRQYIRALESLLDYNQP